MFLRKPFLVLISFLAIFCSTQASAFEFTFPYSLNNQDVNQYLLQKVKLNQSFGFPGFFTFNYDISNMKANIGQEPNRINMSATLTGNFTLLKQDQLQTQIQIEFSALPYYDPNTGAVYLKDFHIIKTDVTPEKYMDDVEKVLPWLNDSMADLLKDTPIYRLNDDKFMQHLIKKFAKAIVVEPNQLEFKVGW
ncbi:DUF1439 domain-containing protein [Actinobacillus delphinicola]|uniref:Uncharacterized lipoprotein yceB n=1 Tax=Actinobacillus delphinicola TaxID=51161 RepID=A0A448TTC0_9PAST|nr:DUF1439 domain-containing protein [Actinobacillus delphinicola]VEJ09166.1 Uncharacterized lipoprotein yceB precursor [Actinobacillus delphinicola]